MIEPFVVRAAAAALLLALVAAPLGCVVVWRRMAYFGETIAQSSLIGVALALALHADPVLTVALVTLAVAALILFLERKGKAPIDAVLGVTHHGALALGIIAASMLKGTSVDLVGYLFGDIFAVTNRDLVVLLMGSAVVAAATAALWPSLVRMSIHEELAAAEGVATNRVRAAFTLLVALAIALAMKIIGILLVIAFLVVPAVAARPLAATPERMVAATAAIAVLAVLGGIGASLRFDVPGGPAIVLIMALLAGVSLAFSNERRRG